MGISTQQYRLRIGLFNGSANLCIKSRRTKNEKTNIEAKPNLKIFFALLPICLSLSLCLMFDNVISLDQNFYQNETTRIFLYEDVIS